MIIQRLSTKPTKYTNISGLIMKENGRKKGN